MPSLTQCCDALADVVAVAGASARASELRDHPAEIDEQAFAALAAELRVLPTQLFSAYIVRLFQTTGFMHPALARVRLLEGALQ
jgi:hypothetical protein